MISATYNDTAADYGAATGFKTTLSDWGPNKADGGYKGGGAQVLLTACDRDQDGVIARYKGVSYAYSDPEVKAVMQAAPYFAALGDSANNETDYTITESYELEQSSSKMFPTAWVCPTATADCLRLLSWRSLPAILLNGARAFPKHWKPNTP